MNTQSKKINPRNRIYQFNLSDEEIRVLSYFAITQTQNVRHFYSIELLKRWVENTFSALMLGLKEQASKTDAEFEGRFKSPSSSNLKFIENVLEEGKGGSITHNEDGTYTIKCSPPLDIIAGKIIAKQCQFPIVSGYSCLEELKKLRKKHTEQYESFFKFQEDEYFKPVAYSPQRDINSISLNVSLEEYINEAIKVLEATKQVLQPGTPDYYDDEKNFANLREKLGRTIHYLKKEQFISPTKSREEQLESLSSLYKDFSYENYQAHKKNYKPLDQSAATFNYNKLAIEEVDKKLEIYRQLLDKNASGKSVAQTIDESDNEFHINATNALKGTIKKVKADTGLDIGFDALIEEYQKNSDDMFDLFNTFYKVERLFSDKTRSGKLLKDLGIRRSKKKMKFKVLENGFVALFIYLDTPLGTIELQIQTQLRYIIQKFGSAAHINENKEPEVIQFPADPYNMSSKEVNKLESDLDYAVPKKFYISFTYGDKELMATVSENHLLDNYESIISEINPNADIVLTTTYNAARETVKSFKTAHALPDGSSKTNVSYSSIEEFIDTYSQQLEELQAQYKLPLEGNYITQTISIREVNKFFEEHPELDPLSNKSTSKDAKDSHAHDLI